MARNYDYLSSTIHLEYGVNNNKVRHPLICFTFSCFPRFVFCASSLSRWLVRGSSWPVRLDPDGLRRMDVVCDVTQRQSHDCPQEKCKLSVIEEVKCLGKN